MLSDKFNNAVTEGLDLRDLGDLMSAASDGDIAGIQKFIDKHGRENLDAVRGEPIGYTAMMWACKAGNVAGVTYMLDNGSSLERPDMNGDTPIIIAAWMGRTELALELLKRGADDKRLNNAGLNASAKAELHGHKETAEAIIKFRIERDRAHREAMEKSREVLKKGLPQKLCAQLAKFKLGGRKPSAP